MTLRPHLPRPQPHTHLKAVKQPSHIAVGHRHPLRHPRATRGVDQIRDLIRTRRRQRGTGLGAHSRIIDIDHHQLMPVQPRTQPANGDRGDRRGVANHEPNPRVGQRRINRQIRRPRFEHRHHRHDRLNATRKHQRHIPTRPRTTSNQQVRQPISGHIELPVRHRPALKPHRHRIRTPSHLRSKQHRNRHRRNPRPGQHRPITPPIQPSTLSRIRAHPALQTRPAHLTQSTGRRLREL